VLRALRGPWERFKEWVVPADALRAGDPFYAAGDGFILTGPEGVRADVRPDVQLANDTLLDDLRDEGSR